MHKLFFFLFLIVSLSTFALDRKEGESDAEYKKRYLESIGVTQAPEPEKAPEPIPDEPHSNPKIEAARQKMLEMQRKRAEKAALEAKNNPVEVQNTQVDTNQDNPDGSLEGEVDKTAADLAEMGGMKKDGQPLEYKESDVKPVKIKDSFLTKMMDSQTKAFLGTMMARSPFADMKKETIEQVFISRNEGNPLGSFLKNNEKPRKILIDFLKHERALPNIVSVINQPEKIKYMGIFAAVILGLAFIMNLMNSKGGIVKRILTKFAIGACAGVLNLGFFIFQFHEEMKPTINIVLKYYHF